MTALLIRDETMSGNISNEFTIDTPGEPLTLKDIIRLRIYHEVEEHNNRRPEYFKGLVQPTDAEATLNGFKIREKRVIDAETQYYRALDAFQKNGFFVLIDNQQYTDLDEEVVFQKNATVSFIKLTPLVGG